MYTRTTDSGSQSASKDVRPSERHCRKNIDRWSANGDPSVLGQLIMVLAVLLVSTSNAQWRSTYEIAFYNRMAAGAFSTAGLPGDNSNGSYNDRTYSIEALIRMFEHKGDAQLLDHVVDNIDYLLSRRDDLRPDPIQNHMGNVTPSWSTTYLSNGSRYNFLLHDAMIIYPMAEFVRVVKQASSSIQSRVAGNTSGHLYSGWTFFAIATDIEDKIHQTCLFHEIDWINYNDGTSIPKGRYRYSCDYPGACSGGHCPDIHPAKYLPGNMQAFMGRVHLSMWLATSPSNTQRRMFYEDRARRIGNMIRWNLVSHTPSQQNHFEWPYWLLGSSSMWPNACGSGMVTYQSKMEDRGHSYYVATFGYELFKSGITYMVNNPILIFDAVDMFRLSQTLINMYEKPLQFYEYVNRSGNRTYPSYDAIGEYPSSLEEMAQWFPLVEFDRDLYQATHKANGGATYLLGLAYCAKYEAKLNPVYIGRNGPASEWRGCTVADLDGNGVPEIAMVRNFDGDIYLYNWNRNVNLGEMQHTQTLEFGSASDWVGLAAGRLNTTTKNYLVAVRRFDKKVFVFEHLSGAMQQVATYSLPASVQPTALTVFRPLGATKDHIVVGASNGNVHVLSYVPGSAQLQLTGIYSTSYASSIVGITGGNIGTTTNANGLLAIAYQNGMIVVTKMNTAMTQFVQASQAISLGGNAQWMALTSGNFDPNLAGSELVASSKADGKLHFLRYNPTIGQLSWIANEPMVRPVVSGGSSQYLRHEVMAAGNLNLDPQRCTKDELVVLRNTDGWAFVYEVKVGNDCILASGGSKTAYHLPSEMPMDAVDELEIYPNPISDDRLYLGGDQSGAVIEIWRSDGGLIKSRGRICEERCIVDVSDLPDGVYLIRSFQGERVRAARFVIAR
jgi:hypothetical protein